MCKLGQHFMWIIQTRGDSERYRTCFTATVQSRMQSKPIGGNSSNASKNVTYTIESSSSLRTVCLVQLHTTIVTTCRFGMLPPQTFRTDGHVRETSLQGCTIAGQHRLISVVRSRFVCHVCVQTYEWYSCCSCSSVLNLVHLLLLLVAAELLNH